MFIVKLVFIVLHIYKTMVKICHQILLLYAVNGVGNMSFK